MIIFTDTSYNNPNLLFSDPGTVSGKVVWNSPANIALIKYWGKRGRQLPNNPSLSFTLKNSVSKTSINYQAVSNEGLTFDFRYNGEPKPEFEVKLNSFFENLIPVFPFLNQLELKIESSNTFPHSVGIASSASGISALALCLCGIEKTEFNRLKHPDDFYRKASFVARLGSGSASRSVYGGLVNWGRIDWEVGSSDYFANKYPLPVDEVFTGFQDSIIILSSEKKRISSTIGHTLMNNHAFADARYAQARANYTELSQALQSGDLMKFIDIVENEALSLHALMMSAKPGYFLLHPSTMLYIDKIRHFRKQTHIPVCFTLDAGPNIHLLYPARYKEEVKAFLLSEIIDENNAISVIYDEVGNGPNQI